MYRTVSKGQKYGCWELLEPLGKGGNGFVWLCSNNQEQQGAIKVLLPRNKRRKEKMNSRFKSEIKVIKENSDIPGILPVLDEYIPVDHSDEFPWYVMPVAGTLERSLDLSDYEIVIRVILKVGETLVKLHDRYISHRDIKPANILVWKNEIYLSEFGLAEYPEKNNITSDREQLGARWTIAPEMQRMSRYSDGKPADVYSLAKTLWILLTGNKDGFEGQYSPDSINASSNFNLQEKEDSGVSFPRPRPLYTRPLDDLLRESTDDELLNRPNIQQFVLRLISWFESHKNFKTQNILQWQDVQLKLFPILLPQRAVWTDLDEITQILNYLGSIENLAHMLLPFSGGMDLLGAQLGSEDDTIELHIDHSISYVVRPKRLIFESFRHDWS